MVKRGVLLLCGAFLFSCGGAEKVRPVTNPLAAEVKAQREKQVERIDGSVARPNWSSTPRVVYAKPVWIPPVIRRIYVPPHEAPDGSLVAGYYVWKIVVPGRWRKPGEDVGAIPVRAEVVTPQKKADTVRPQDAEAIKNFLREVKEKLR